MNYPKVLVVSNNSFSLTNSNGRTLGNYFIDWPKECLAQFCISTDGPNYNICNNYYCITDKEVLSAFINCKKARGTVLQSKDFSKNKYELTHQKKLRKNSCRVLLRHLIWKFNRWRSPEFIKWIDKFNPNLILLQSGDSAFMLHIATQLSKERKVPLIIFNSEGFYFFKKTYMHKCKIDWFCFPIYHKIYRNQFRKTMLQASYSIYLNTLLKEDYDKEFKDKKSIVLYSSSTLSFCRKPFNANNPKFSYLGNFGYDRPRALVEIAETLQSINKNYYLDVYGNAFSSNIVDLFNSCEGIHFHGALNYEYVIRVIKKSDILFHAESQNKIWKESLKYGFSTKIADSLASGKSFFLYSSPDIACAKYIIQTGAGWFAKNKNDLKSELTLLISDEEKRKKVLEKAREVSFQNHNLTKNRNKFRDILFLVHSGMSIMN